MLSASHTAMSEFSVQTKDILHLLPDDVDLAITYDQFICQVCLQFQHIKIQEVSEAFTQGRKQGYVGRARKKGVPHYYLILDLETGKSYKEIKETKHLIEFEQTNRELKEEVLLLIFVI